MWEQIFGLANALALLAWLVLAFAPRPAWAMSALFYGSMLALALGYCCGLILLLVGVIPADSGADFSSIAGVRAIFASDAGATIGWVHYLAFDLFVGLWIARDAARRGWTGWKARAGQVPILFLTFMAGPLGLTCYLIARKIFPSAQHIDMQAA